MILGSSEASSRKTRLSSPEACTLCEELQTAAAVNQLSGSTEATGIQNNPVGRTNDLVLIPSVGALTRGHMLIVPREHQFSVLGFDYLREQTEELLEVAFDRFCEDGHVILAFEHGSRFRLPEKRSCTTLHAHVHSIPLHRSIANRVMENVPYVVDQSPNPWSLVGGVSNEFVCSFLWDGSGAYTACGVTEMILPSQTLRRLVAEQLRLPEWDWQKMVEYREGRFVQKYSLL